MENGVNEDTLSAADREPARKSVTLPNWMWRRIENAQETVGVRSESEIIRQVVAATVSGHSTIWDYLRGLDFEQLADGSLRAQTDDGFFIRVAPQTAGRWSAAAWHEADPRYDIPYPTWQHSCMAAQIAAVAGLDHLRRETPTHYVKVVGAWLKARGKAP